MNYYEEKQQARKERYQALAERKQSESDTLYDKTVTMANMIPFGQPVLVGHHSERGHRRFLDKIHNSMGKSIELEKTAEYYQNKADNMGNAISSDDPDAITKLEAKLAERVKLQETMKQMNADARKKGEEKPVMAYQL